MAQVDKIKAALTLDSSLPLPVAIAQANQMMGLTPPQVRPSMGPHRTPPPWGPTRLITDPTREMSCGTPPSSPPQGPTLRRASRCPLRWGASWRVVRASWLGGEGAGAGSDLWVRVYVGPLGASWACCEWCTWCWGLW